MLTEGEKLTLGMILREKIVETHDLEDVIHLQISESTTNQAKSILQETLVNVATVREDCYSIAIKLGVK